MKDGTFSEISLIFEQNETVFLILRKLQTSSVQNGPRHLKKISTEIADEYFVVSAEELSGKCVLIQTERELYISDFPNRFESD